MNQTQIEQDYQEALGRIHHAKETQAISLDLSGLIWDQIPPELFELTWLEELALQQSGDPWKEPYGDFPILPEGLIQLQTLRQLNIRKLGVKNLTPLAQLQQLTSLDCRDNQLTDLSPLAQLQQLTSLNCGFNPLTDLASLKPLVIKRQFRELFAFNNPAA